MVNQVSISEEIRDNKKVFVIENADINQEELREVIEDYLEEPEVRPEIVEKIKKIEREGKFKEFSSIGELRESIENA
jgi:polyribonucleotide nucleotidyltransferase